MEQIWGNIELLIDYPMVNLQIILDGLMIGSVFALAAYGLALVWGVMNVKNLAQGEFVIGGGYVAWYLTGLGAHPLLGVPAAFVTMALLGGAVHGTVIQRNVAANARAAGALAVIAGVCFVVGLYLAQTGPGQEPDTLGLVLKIGGATALFALFVAAGGTYGLIISRVIERDLFTSLLATFGLAIMMAQIMNLLFGSDTQNIKLPYETVQLLEGDPIGVGAPMGKLIGVILAAILAIGVVFFMRSTRMGQAIRATAQDARAARVLGINTEKVYAFTFSLNSAICGAAGAIIVMVWVIQPFFGITHSIRAFVIVTAAGLGNLPGVIGAGLGLGALEQYGSHVFGIGYQQAIAVLLLLFVLAIRLAVQRRKRQVLK